MHITDTLVAGGQERIAVNLVNLLPRDRYLAYLCTTRREGPLADLVSDDVRRLRLGRWQRFDIAAAYRFVTFIQSNNIQILHAHNHSLFIASMATFFPPYPKLVWHDNYGGQGTLERPVWSHRLAVSRARGIIAVNQSLMKWSRHRLGVPAERIWYIPNFVTVTKTNGKPLELPGTINQRIVCVANFKPQKDHFNLLRAMAFVVQRVPTAHLLLVGAVAEETYFNLVREEIVQLGLGQNVSLLGERQDVSSILQACDIGVLSSASEGLPLALLEYGRAGLPVIATNVGDCARVLDEGRVGILVPPRSPKHLAESLLSLLQFPERRSGLGKQFHHHVQKVYDQFNIVNQFCRMYETVLGSANGGNGAEARGLGPSSSSQEYSPRP